ncbi:MAG: transglutaminase-like domain-containing protein, partial [Planctomycetota bacterium]
LRRRFAAAADIEQAAWLVHALDQPRHDEAEAGRARLDQVAWAMPGWVSDAAAVAEYLHDDLGLAGDRHDYHAPANSLLARVLERRCGIPLSLTVLWAALCRRRGIEAEIIALPGHVIGGWAGGYIDCFAGGRSVTAQTIDAICLAGGVVDPRPYLVPAAGRRLKQRLAANLAYAYQTHGDSARGRLAQDLAANA